MPRLCLLVLLVACSHGERPAAAPKPATPENVAAETLPPSPPLPPALPPDPRYFAGGQIPDPLSCLEDKDCIASSIVDTETGCCLVQSDPMPQTWAWHAWVAEHRLSSDCQPVECKPVAVPATLPRVCLLQARCDHARCTNSCEEGDAGVK